MATTVIYAECVRIDDPLDFTERAAIRAHLEIFGRTMESDGRMRSTVARRLSTLGSFYRYCHVEGILERNPAANVRRPKVDVRFIVPFEDTRRLLASQFIGGGLLAVLVGGCVHDVDTLRWAAAAGRICPSSHAVRGSDHRRLTERPGSSGGRIQGAVGQAVHRK